MMIVSDSPGFFGTSIDQSTLDQVAASMELGEAGLQELFTRANKAFEDTEDSATPAVLET